jgi:hypothetical protein
VRRSLIIAAIVTAVAVTTAPAAATAATASISNGQLRYESAPGEADGLKLYLSGPNYYFTRRLPNGAADPNPNIAAGPGCEPNPDGADCPAALVSSIAVALADGNDQADVGDAPSAPIPLPVEVDAGAGDDSVRSGGATSTIFGGGGNDRLVLLSGGLAEGGAGDDVLSGSRDQVSLRGGEGDDVLAGTSGGDALEAGPGDDFVGVETEAGFGVETGDQVSCGAGLDGFTADSRDRLDTDCEEPLKDQLRATLRTLLGKLKHLGIAGVRHKRKVSASFRAPGPGVVNLLEPANAHSLSGLVFDGGPKGLVQTGHVTITAYVTRRGLKKLRRVRRYTARFSLAYHVEFAGEAIVRGTAVLK